MATEQEVIALVEKKMEEAKLIYAANFSKEMAKIIDNDILKFERMSKNDGLDKLKEKPPVTLTNNEVTSH